MAEVAAQLEREAVWRASGPPLWFLRSRPGAATVAAATTVVMVALFALCVLVWDGRAGLQALTAPAQWALIAFFTLSLGMLAGISRLVFPAAVEDLRALAPQLQCSPELTDRLQAALVRYPLRNSLMAIPLAAVIGILHVLLLGQTTPFTGLQIAATLGTLLIWQMMFQIALPLVHNAHLFDLLGRCCRIDLYRPETLQAFGRTAIRPCLLIIGLQCAYAIFLLSDQTTLSPGLLLGLVASMGLVAGLFFMPLKGIRRALLQQRASTLARLDRQLAALPAPDQQLTDATLQRTQALLVLRNQIQHVSSWPLGFEGVRRMLFYLILVPLTWVGAATVEMLMDGRL